MHEGKLEIPMEECMENQGLGLSEIEAAKRLSRNGRNELKKPKGKSLIGRFWEQLQDPLIYVLMVAAFVSILLKEYSDAAIIGVVVLLNACVGLIQEGKARKALEALEGLQSPMAMVIRDGREKQIPAAEVVVGDLVCLEAGDRVPADVRLVEAMDLRMEEAALTGESMPIRKQMNDMAYASTMTVAGKGRGMVTAVGMQTELGKIAGMIHRDKEEPTPLQRRLGELGTVLSFLSLLLCAVLFGIAVLQKRDVFQMLITAISLAVAAVPEGLPAVVTICLALSVTRLVKAGTIVRRLPCVETLGSVNVVCSDKTGTLTQNRMTAEMGYWDGKLRSFRSQGDKAVVDQKSLYQRHAEISRKVVACRVDTPPTEYLRAMVLCNNAVLKGRMGDPTELALLQLGEEYGMLREKLEQELPRVGELPFSSEAKQMTTIHRGAGESIAYRKGAPDIVLRCCQTIYRQGKLEPLTWQDRSEIQKATEDLARMAYRTLALAMQSGGRAGKEDAWTFLGLIAMGDPPRPEAAGAVEVLKGAGVETIMITGDHAATALAIGKQLGIAGREEQCMTGLFLETLSDKELSEAMERRRLRIFARVTPAQKMRIVKALQSQGKIVAMTGDGVNDAPSLRAADVGIAMGRSGTDVAKEAADMVLTDDHFATIERAIEEGRGVYENIRKSVIFLLSSNLGELLTMFAAVACGFASPLKSSHVLWINLITDSLPALALGVDQNDGRALMQCSPRKAKESLFSRGGLGCTCFYGLLIAGISLTAFFLPVLSLMGEVSSWPERLTLLRSALEKDEFLVRGQTYAFTVLGMCQLFHAIGMRDVNRSIFGMKHLKNKVMLLAFGLGFLLQLAVTEIPFLVHAFGTVPLTFVEWGMLTGLAAMPLFAHELFVLFQGRSKKN
ncbi:MAG: cation-translocating P-type ATPase [Lachnospiraceae bacterium]|nr:cation-translocating P-type ATPase [Lachnospiraceae bacterium]